jgi:hypothetical protein
MISEKGLSWGWKWGRGKLDRGHSFAHFPGRKRQMVEIREEESNVESFEKRKECQTTHSAQRKKKVSRLEAVTNEVLLSALHVRVCDVSDTCFGRVSQEENDGCTRSRRVNSAAAM